MRKIFLLLACICGLGFGQPNWDNPKCYEADRIMDGLFDKGKAENDKRYIAASFALLSERAITTKCECAETIACGKATFCTSFKCPNAEETVSIFSDINRLLAKENFYFGQN